METKTLTVSESDHLEDLVAEGKHEELYEFLEENTIRLNADPMTEDGYKMLQLGETLLNCVFHIGNPEDRKKTNEVLRAFGATRYRGPHWKPPDLVIDPRALKAPWN